jgi:hypothetical protein
MAISYPHGYQLPAWLSATRVAISYPRRAS